MDGFQTSVRGGWLRPLRKLGLAAARHWPWPVQTTIQSGRAMFVDLRSGVGRALYMKGDFDPAVFEPFRAVLRPGDVFLDVGANVGFYSLLALDQVGDTGAVHAFEIDERPLRCLRKTIRHGRIANLDLHEQAVGAAAGRVFLQRETDCGNSHVETTGAGNGVTMTTLDHWLVEHPAVRVRAMKIDIEGGEFAALQGARRLLDIQKPLVVCEVFENYQDRTGRDPAELTALLQSHGYVVRPLLNGWSPGLVATPPG